VPDLRWLLGTRVFRGDNGIMIGQGSGNLVAHDEDQTMRPGCRGVVPLLLLMTLGPLHPMTFPGLAAGFEKAPERTSDNAGLPLRVISGRAAIRRS